MYQRTSWSQLVKGLHIGALAATAPSLYRSLLVEIREAIRLTHDETEHTDASDWPPGPRPLRPDLLEQFGPNPVVSLNRAIAVAMVHGPSAGRDLLVELERDKRLAQHHRLLATRAHLLERLGRHQAAARAYCEAAGQNHQRLRAPPPHPPRPPPAEPGMTWTERTVVRDDVRIRSDLGGSGPPVVLLHGLAGHAGEWDTLTRSLRRRSLVVALDQRGHGASERRPGDVSRAAYVADTVAAVGHLGLDRPVLAVQSLGGHTALLTPACCAGSPSSRRAPASSPRTRQRTCSNSAPAQRP
ncbi:alpha/beta fold hydrolase [Streptomyces collinus]|uniref:alpha/beta fold hydrolase n=1 Tax=Streptomyces collinus TaxID=42684 RepID=UPI00368452E9